MRYHRFLRYSTYWRYGIFILTIFFSWYGLQARVNLKSIDTSIQQTKDQVHELDQKTAFLENFYKPYLESDYAPYFMSHENGSLPRGEFIVRMRHTVVDDDPKLPQIEKKNSILLTTPEESRHYFIDQKLPFLYDWGLIKKPSRL